MAWESALDRLVLRQIHLAEAGKCPENEVRRVVADYAAFCEQRPSNAFSSGYARVLLGVDLARPSGGAAARWYEFGRLKAHQRRGDESFFDDAVEHDATILDLLAEPRIAAQILPLFVRRCFQTHEFERAIQALELIAARADGANDTNEVTILVDAALLDLLARVERAGDRIACESGLRRALKRAMELPGFEALAPKDRARFDRSLGVSHLRAGEWASADERFERALATAELDAAPGQNAELTRDLKLQRVLASLHVSKLEELRPDAERADRARAIEVLSDGLSGGTSTRVAPLLRYARGILHYEAGDTAEARVDFEAAHRVLTERVHARDASEEQWLPRCSYWFGASLFASDERADRRRAAELVRAGLAEVAPDVATFYDVYDPLKAVDTALAFDFLDRIELGRGASPENLALVGLEYQGLGEPERALEAAARVLHIATDLDQRLDAYKLQLTAHNMKGDTTMARESYFALRDLLMQRGRFDVLERTLQDEALVGQALDHLEVKVELASLYEEMEGKEWDRAHLQMQIARSFKARKDVDDLRQAIGILEEVGLQFPDLCAEDLSNVQKLLELRSDDAPANALRPVDAFAERIGRRPRILVVGGNEQQRKHHPRLDKLAADWDFQAEWLMANYASPQKLVKAICDRLDSCDLLVLLHWNRHETTEPALEKARAAGVPARTLFYAGFTSLQVGIEDLCSKLSGTPA